jgi:hypothetical protein
MNKLNAEEKVMTVPLMKTISRQNEALANKIGSLIVQVYNDA